MTGERRRGTALVLGLGRFGGGRSAAQFLAARGWALRIADRAEPETLAAARRELAALERDIDWRLGGEHGEDILDGVELVVVNPAVKPDHPLPRAAAARGIATTQEVNLFLESFPGRVVLVTGTNGKSTTATLLASCLRQAGQRTLLGGNIGRSLLEDAATWSEDGVAVLEISSAQLSRVDPARHRVAGAVVTRITTDHLDWHGSLDAYREAKRRALEAADEFVVHAADDECAARATTRAQRVRFRNGPPEAGEVGVTDDGWVTSRLPGATGHVVHRDASNLVGCFHLENLAAAFGAAAHLGIARETAGFALARVAPLRHRLQLAGTAGGRRLYGNAVSTEVQSTLSALTALDGPVHWVGGGKSKDGDVAGVASRLAPHVASAHVFGASAEELVRAFGGAVPTTCHARLEDALDAAWAQARPGESVLFSPAFASFDQFSNFRERAEAFEAWSAVTLADSGLPQAASGR